MGKRQHQKDKMYLTSTEWSTLYGGKKPGQEVGNKAPFRRLRFDHCALSLQPFEHPLCTPEGVIYDLMTIVPFLKKFGIDPASGKPLDAKSLIKLNFRKNADNKYHCPVLYKVFNENSHIVAISTTGNVFSYEAVEQLNIKAKSFRDLLTDEEFTRKDIITLQDPSNLQKFDLTSFHHLKHNLRVIDEEEEKAKCDPAYILKSVSAEARDTLEELNREYKAPEKKEEVTVKADKYNAAHYSTGAVAASSTSTIMAPTTVHEPAIADDDDILRYTRIKKKGYVQLQTNMGPLNLELHCDITPKAAENFIKLCDQGYYNNTLFHRSIRNFMIQGGDPTGTGKGGESAWEKPFKDEFKPNLNHQGRGILSMANTGPNTNKSQFFITYRSCRHLDNKHSIFGRVVGGLETLNNMERIEVDNKDKPIEDIVLLKAVVFVNPYEEIDKQIAKEREEEEEKKKEEEKALSSQKRSRSTTENQIKIYHQGVGKYINPSVSKVSAEEIPVQPKKKKEISGNFGDFSSW